MHMEVDKKENANICMRSGRTYAHMTQDERQVWLQFVILNARRFAALKGPPAGIFPSHV